MAWIRAILNLLAAALPVLAGYWVGKKGKGDAEDVAETKDKQLVAATNRPRGKRGVADWLRNKD